MEMLVHADFIILLMKLWTIVLMKHLGGYNDRVIVTIKKDGSVSVEDHGRGIPVDMHPVEKRICP
ncbi:MAG: hypothetical protein MZV64_56555 [Ignavibacteriales bacterium]|nr:hypothetical protein [Ignavibacteriales bacterium]